jgi:hypothetical protein
MNGQLASNLSGQQLASSPPKCFLQFGESEQANAASLIALGIGFSHPPGSSMSKLPLLCFYGRVQAEYENSRGTHGEDMTLTVNAICMCRI